jgi:hypothetical protein
MHKTCYVCKELGYGEVEVYGTLVTKYPYWDYDCDDSYRAVYQYRCINGHSWFVEVDLDKWPQLLEGLVCRA